MSREARSREAAVGAAPPVPPGLTVQHLETWSAASTLLSRSALDRLCGKEFPNQARRAQLDLSQVIVATYHDEPMGFAAYKPSASNMRVAHELWVDANAPCGVAPAVVALLRQLETGAVTSGCSKLFVVVSQATPLRRILQTDGYTITLEGEDLLWLEKALRSEPEKARGKG
jgi:hypothetical protein